ncbi:MAG: hypothetical protein Q9204_001952 [Flavoplaca sp. TL-2023a]
MANQLSAPSPSKICRLTYQCGHSRRFRMEEITSELTALQDHDDGGRLAVSSPSSPSPTSSLSSSFVSLSSTSTKGSKEIATTGGNDLALLRVVDPEVLCPACTSTASHSNSGLWLRDDSDDETRGPQQDQISPKGEDVLFERLVSGDGDQEEGKGWWDVLDLDELFDRDGGYGGEVSDDWERLGEVIESFELV